MTVLEVSGCNCGNYHSRQSPTSTASGDIFSETIKTNDAENVECAPEISDKSTTNEDVEAQISKSALNDNLSPLSKDEIQSLLLKEAEYDCRQESLTRKRAGYIVWDDFFMAVASLSALRSKDPISQSGACIVDDENKIRGIGYNGFARGCPDDCLPWTQTSDAAKSSIPWLHTSNPYAVHAEVNAILNKCSADVAGARMYVQDFPCNDCAKVIIQSRIQEVVYMNDKQPELETYRASRILLTMARVKLRRYKPSTSSISIEFVSALAPTTDEVDDVSTDVGAAKRENNRERFRELLLQEANYDPVTTTPSSRKDYISWDDYFMSMCFLAAKRSKDPNTQVGACIVDSDKRIVGVGYNGFPRSCSDDDLPWSRDGDVELHKKYLYVCHAEVNAILNKCSADVKGATLYVALFPCNECAKMIIQAGIREVVFMCDKYHNEAPSRASRIMFQMAQVRLRKYIPSVQHLSIPLGEENTKS